VVRNKNDFQDPATKWHVEDVLFNIIFFTGIILMATSWIHDSFEASAVTFVAGIFVTLIITFIGLMATDTIMNSHKDWCSRRKMFWWLSWAVPRDKPKYS